MVCTTDFLHQNLRWISHPVLTPIRIMLDHHLNPAQCCGSSSVISFRYSGISYFFFQLCSHSLLSCTKGKTAADLVKSVLSVVPNPHRDADIEQLNQIRQSLATIASNSTGWSLSQPHLQRTRLCELQDSELDPKYIEQRDGLKALVQDLVRPKTFLGKRTTGKDLADLVSNLVAALNSQEIPNVASMLKVFNQDLVCSDVYVSWNNGSREGAW